MNLAVKSEATSSPTTSDKTVQDMNLEVADRFKCSKLYSEIENMKSDYDDWKNVLTKTYFKVQNEIKLWERAIEKVQETVTNSSVENTFYVKNDENEIFVTITFTPTQSRCIKIMDGNRQRSFTLPDGLGWIQRIIANLNQSLKKIDLDQNYISSQQAKLYATEKYLINMAKAQLQNAMGTEGQAKVNGYLVKKPDDLTALMNHRESEFKAFMLKAEESSALISNLTDEVLVLLYKLTSMNSAMLTDSIVDGIRKEIDELLERFGKENTTAEAAKCSSSNPIGPTKIAPTKYISKNTYDTTNYFKDMEFIKKLVPTANKNKSEPVLVDLDDIRRIQIKLIELEASRSGGTKNGLSTNQSSLSDLSDIQLGDKFSVDTNKIGSHANSDKINTSENYSLHINFVISSGDDITISKIDLERKENDFAADVKTYASESIKIRASVQNSNKTQTQYRKDLNTTKSSKCDSNASLDQSSEGIKTLNGEKESASDKMNNESSGGMCQTKCENDSVSCPPNFISELDKTLETLSNTVKSISLDCAGSTNIDPTEQRSNKKEIKSNDGDYKPFNSRLQVPDILRERTHETPVNEEDCAECTSKLICKNESSNINMEIKSGTEKINYSILDRNSTTITIQVCNVGKYYDDSFDPIATDDLKSKMKRNKIFSVQDMT